MPLGGSELCSGYKGYGLAMLVEIVCGILAGGEYGPKIRRWKNTDRVANLVKHEFLCDDVCLYLWFKLITAQSLEIVSQRCFSNITS